MKPLLRAQQHHMDGNAALQLDMAAVRDRKRRMVAGLLDMHKSVFASSGADLILGRGRLVGPHAVQVQLASHIESDGHGEGEAASGSEESQSNKTRMLTADHIILCTGSRANLDLGISGLEAANPLTHIELLDLDSVPRHLVILGGGYIGLEFAQVFRRFGAAVSVMERGSRMLKGEDADVSSALVDILRDEGVAFFPDTHVSRVSGTSGGNRRSNRHAQRPALRAFRLPFTRRGGPPPEYTRCRLAGCRRRVDAIGPRQGRRIPAHQH